MSLRSKAPLIALLAVAALFGSRAAADGSAMDGEVLQVANDWARIKYQVRDKGEQLREMDALAHRAGALAGRYPGQASPLLWKGIATSEEAGMAGVLQQLGYAVAARRIFEQSEAIEPRGANGAVLMSLGVLYYRVPGFPMAFGDDRLARKDLETALAMDPDGLDANFFYGDYLVKQGEFAKAKTVLARALRAPRNPQRPVWDAGRRAEVQALLAKIDRR